MVAFFEIAQVVQPITVCVRRTPSTPTRGRLQGGEQQINAQQAVSFVRQRRDTSTPSCSSPTSIAPAASRPSSSRCSPSSAELDPHEPGEDQRDRRRCPAQHGDRQRPRPDHAGQDREHPPRWQPQLLPPAGGGFDNVDGQDVNVVDLAAIRATVKSSSTHPRRPRPRRFTTPDTVHQRCRHHPRRRQRLRARWGRQRPCSTASPPRVSPAARASTGTTTEASSLAYAAGDADPPKALATYLGGVTPREDHLLERRHDGADRRVGLDPPIGLGPTAAPASSPAPSGSAAAPVDATGGASRVRRPPRSPSCGARGSPA